MYKAIYSQKAVDAGYGTSFWLDKDGNEIEVTSTINESERVDWRKVYTWNDAVMKGIVVKFARVGKEKVDLFDWNKFNREKVIK